MTDTKLDAVPLNEKSQARRIRGQGLTEYIIIVAMIALASIAAVNFFGGAVQGAFGGMGLVLSGEAPTAGTTASKTAAEKAVTEAGKTRNLGNYTN